MPPLAVVIQPYVKRDTLVGLLHSLVRCHGVDAVDLILWCDVPPGDDPDAPLTRAAASVRGLIENVVARQRDTFRSIHVHRNSENQGAYVTCRAALDYAFSRHEFAVFAEDDVVFARDALEWFSAMRSDPVFREDRCWALAGESLFFDAAGRPIPSGWVPRMRDLAQTMRYDKVFNVEGFVPSTCFGTTARKWAEFGHTRGQQVGDVAVCDRCRDEGRVSLFPLVARVVDVGERHALGWSVAQHTMEGVSVTKNTYLTSDDIARPAGEPPAFSLYNGSKDRLWRLTSLLDAQYHPGLVP